ncbi:MAG TPA: tRNA glutamyl-Q(34) synthetase GluQRS [Hyphomicrobiaceae bacterium]|nr:tRNA glutamyl-Q(34) synthetase GluQRS [Hyphomicrobiaceae bacterium]
MSIGSAQPVLRFAPSPNGELHLGHALSALFGYRMARRLRGRFLLRIEDIDIGRCRPEHVSGIFRDLRWLGVEWEEPVIRQSECMPVYAAAAAKLTAMGLLYPCFATRAEISSAAAGGPLDPDGAPVYPGLHRDLPVAEVVRRKTAGQPFAMRLNMKKALTVLQAKLSGRALTFGQFDLDGGVSRIAADPERWGDVILQRKDVPTSYHLAVVVDDARQGITHVTRGQDLLAATDIQRLLQVLLDLPEPVYRHHPLITDASGRKLAKSARDQSLRELREAGATPDDVIEMVQEVCTLPS